VEREPIEEEEDWKQRLRLGDLDYLHPAERDAFEP
jgi:hypothetical protein